MCLNMMNRSKSQSSTTTSVATPEKKKKPTLLNQKGGGKDFSSPTSGVDVGNAGQGGFDSFGNAPK